MESRRNSLGQELGPAEFDDRSYDERQLDGPVQRLAPVVHYEDATATLFHGDCLDVLANLPAESIDACVTDPPYGIGFMGKEWDTFKPGSHKVGRGDQRIASSNPNINGRSRSPAISPSQIEYDRSLSGQRGFQEWTECWAREVLRVLKPGGHIVVCGAPRSFHRMGVGLEDAGFEIRDCLSWLYGQGFPKSLNLGDGIGTALKPSWEPCVLGRKPFKGTVKANVEAHGTGALNIDACRIETDDSLYGGGYAPRKHGNAWAETGGMNAAGRCAVGFVQPEGRWPANVCLDEIAAMVLDEQAGELTSGANPTRRSSDKFRGIYQEFKGQEECEAARGLDIGGASRFYYVAKPSREERDMGCYDLPARSGGEATDRADGSAGLGPRAGAGRNGGARNIHPTVKPVALMRWLVRLVTPVNGVVIDPFLGSGTTGMASRYEQRRFIGIEREAEYLELSERRIRSAAPLFGVSDARLL